MRSQPARTPGSLSSLSGTSSLRYGERAGLSADMDRDLYRRTHALADDLATDRARPVKDTSANTYSDKLRGNWVPYALAHGLPDKFTRGSVPLSVDHIASFIVACKDGTVRSHSRDGRRRADLEGKPLAPSTLDGILAALRHTHLANGLTWNGDDPKIKDLRRGYATTSDHTRTVAAPLTPDHLRQLFIAAPSSDLADSSTMYARARATATALRIGLAKLPKLTRDSLTVTDERATVALAGGVLRTTECLRRRLDDPIAAAVCAHCHLLAWQDEGSDVPFFPEEQVTSLRGTNRLLIDKLPHAHVHRDVIAVDDDDLWTIVAIGLDRNGAAWMRMRAALLPMFATGLRLDDIDGLRHDAVAFAGNNVTMSIVGKTESSDRPHITTMKTEGGPLCPVRAMRHYDAWTRAYLPVRSHWMPALKGKTSSVPFDTAGSPGGRALYQAARSWLLESGVAADVDALRTRAALTPHSARHGFAQQAHANGAGLDAIQDAMRHSKADTTNRYLGATDDAAATILDRIADDTP